MTDSKPSLMHDHAGSLAPGVWLQATPSRHLPRARFSPKQGPHDSSRGGTSPRAAQPAATTLICRQPQSLRTSPSQSTARPDHTGAETS